jgi:hypothetical protein
MSYSVDIQGLKVLPWEIIINDAARPKKAGCF